MLISWIIKTTLLDYPGKVATIIFTSWCNFRCSYCHNPDFVLPEKIKNFNDFIPEEIFFNFLRTKIWILDWVVICWWEPSLQNDLINFCEKIKNLWFLVKLDTNWSNPNVIEKLINNKLVDYIAMDVKFDFEDLEKITQVKWNKNDYLKSVEIITKSWIDYEFRTTLIKNHHNIDNFEKLLKNISWAKKYFLQNYKSWNTLKHDFDWESFSNNELINFKNIASKYVEKCEIRI